MTVQFRGTDTSTLPIQQSVLNSNAGNNIAYQAPSVQSNNAAVNSNCPAPSGCGSNFDVSG